MVVSYSRNKPTHRSEDNIKIVLQDEGCGGMDWIELAFRIGTVGVHL